MGTHNICFCGEIRKNIRIFRVIEVSSLEQWISLQSVQSDQNLHWVCLDNQGSKSSSDGQKRHCLQGYTG